MIWHWWYFWKIFLKVIIYFFKHLQTTKYGCTITHHTKTKTIQVYFTFLLHFSQWYALAPSKRSPFTYCSNDSNKLCWFLTSTFNDVKGSSFWYLENKKYRILLLLFWVWFHLQYIFSNIMTVNSPFRKPRLLWTPRLITFENSLDQDQIIFFLKNSSRNTIRVSVWIQIRPNKMSGLIWIQTVRHSDGIPERISF